MVKRAPTTVLTGIDDDGGSAYILNRMIKKRTGFTIYVGGKSIIRSFAKTVSLSERSSRCGTLKKKMVKTGPKRCISEIGICIRIFEILS